MAFWCFLTDPTHLLYSERILFFLILERYQSRMGLIVMPNKPDQTTKNQPNKSNHHNSHNLHTHNSQLLLAAVLAFAMTKKEEEEEEEEVEEPEDFGLYTEKARIKRESKNSNKYRKYYTNLLKEHQGVLQEAWEGATTTTATTAATNASHNDDETLSRSQESKLIQDMWESERNAIGMGVLCGLAFFGVVRRLPRFLIRHVGGEHKIREVQKADEAAKESGTYVYQRAFGTCVWF